MQVIHGTVHLDAPLGPVLTIGNFDGVHLGHRALIDRTLGLGGRIGAPSAAFTFHPAPQDVLRPGTATPRLQTLEQKLEVLGTTGLDYVIVEPFTSALGAVAPEPFAREFLVKRLGIRGLVLGHDFRFGKGRAGTAESLRAHLQVPIDEVDAVLHDGQPVSSSRIRSALTAGSVAEAAILLGRPHELTGIVGHGHERGRVLGFPTANLEGIEGMVPHHGVYAVRVRVGDAWHRAVANVGTRPTFQGQGTAVEAHLLDFRGELYGQALRVAFVDRLRDERRFDGVEALVQAITHDVAAARDRLG